MNPIEEFKAFRKKNIRYMAKNKKIKKIANDFVVEADKIKYEYNFNWLGRPIIQFPQDIVALQEIIWEVKPDLIIETGIAHGGSLIFYASILELIGKGMVLGIDIDIRKHNRKEIEKHKLFKRIVMLEGSSIDNTIIKQVKNIVKKHRKVLICLDSLHTHEHVLSELNLYSKFVSKNSYLIAMDTSIELMPKGTYKNRPWDKGNNPATAVTVFLKNHKNFTVNKNIENKLLITSSPSGFLQRIK